MSNDQQWEFCQLIAEGSRDKGGQGYYEVSVRYMGTATEAPKVLSRKEGQDAHPWFYVPWARAMAELGLGGWELVSVQNNETHSPPYDLAHHSFIAYFKRPVRAGRPVTDPPIKLE